MTASLAEVIAAHGRGGAHKRSRADEQVLAAAVAERLGLDARPSLYELWLACGFPADAQARLGVDGERLFEIEPGLTKIVVGKLEALTARQPDKRRRAAEWWLKQAHGKSSRRAEAMLCRPVLVDRLAAQLGRERQAQVREALTGALALVVANYFPDVGQRQLLVSLVGDRHPGVRFFAVQGLAGLLGRGGQAGDLDLVSARLKDGASGVRTAAEQALRRAVDDGRVESAAVEGLIALGDDSDAR
jgi:hypothetical protein